MSYGNEGALRSVPLRMLALAGAASAAFCLSTAPASADYIYGDDGPNTLVGTAQKDSIKGNAGNDTIQGLGGNDFLRGNRGADTVHGGDGRDSVFGQIGPDKLYGGAGADYLTPAEGPDLIRGGAGDDEVFLSADPDGRIDRIFCGAGVDKVNYYDGVVDPLDVIADNCEIVQTEPS